VGSLYFLKLATRSSFVYLSPLSSVSLPRAAAALPAMCRALPRPRAALRQATCRPGTCPAAPRPRAGFFPSCHAARLSARAASRRCSPSQHLQHHLLLPAAPTCHSPASRHRSSPCCPLLCAPRYPRLWPNHAVAAMHAAGCQLWLPHDPVLVQTPNTTWSFLRACSCICTHYFRSIFSCSDHHTSPDIIRGFGSPSAAPTTAPHPRSEAQTAPLRPTEAHRANQSQVPPLE
jgi:hypothetical protein